MSGVCHVEHGSNAVMVRGMRSASMKGNVLRSEDISVADMGASPSIGSGGLIGPAKDMWDGSTAAVDMDRW